MNEEIVNVVENNEETVIEVAKTFKEIWHETPVSVKLVALAAGIAIPVVGYFVVKAVRCLRQKLKAKLAESEKKTETDEAVVEDTETETETEE